MPLGTVTSNTGSGTSITSKSITTTGGANAMYLMFVNGYSGNGSNVIPTDTLKNIYIPVFAGANVSVGGPGVFSTQLYYCVSPLGGTMTVTAQVSAPDSFIAYNFVEFIGINPRNPINTIGTPVAQTALPELSNSLTPTSTNAGVVVFGFDVCTSQATGVTWVHGADGFTQAVANGSGGLGPTCETQYKTGLSTATYQMNVSSISGVSGQANITNMVLVAFNLEDNIKLYSNGTYQAFEFVESSAAGPAMKQYSNNYVLVKQMGEIASQYPSKLYSNGMFMTAQFVEG
jgi:hypothetical protein